MKILKHLPNFLTLTNLLLGCIASVYAFRVHDWVYDNITFFDNGLAISAMLILAATVLDFFDGFFARFLKAESELGKQLDSLADLITFGFAPGVIMYKMLSISYQPQVNAFDIPYALFFAGFGITCFAALRLARFNINKNESSNFRGLPTPAVAILVASLPLILKTDINWLSDIVTNNLVLYGIIFFVCWLMVSNLSMISLKFKSFNWRGNSARYIFLILVSFILAGSFYLGSIFASLPIIIFLYILISMINNIINPKKKNEIQS